MNRKKREADTSPNSSQIQQDIIHLRHERDLILNAVGEGIVGLDPEGKINLANRVALNMMDWKLRDVQGFDHHELMHHSRRDGKAYPREKSSIVLSLQDGKTRRVDRGFLWKKSGTGFPAAYIATPIIEDETITGLVVAFWDISEYAASQEMLKNAIQEQFKNEQKLVETLEDLKRLNQELHETQSQLIQAEKMQSVGRLAAGVAHEVKNPLAILLQGLDFLTDSLEKEDEVIQTTLRDMVEAVNRADGVIRGLLDYATPSETELARVDLNQLLDDSLLLVKHLISKSGVRIEKEYGEGIPVLEIDKNRMQQVFVNLMSNSLYAMPKGGRLEVRTVSEDIENGGQRVTIEIGDNGPGIPEKMRHKLFDPFFTTRRGYGGTGLGLSVVKGIVDFHKGDIQIDNKPEGGARARISLYKTVS